MAQLAANTIFLFSNQCLLACCFFLLFKATRYFHVTHAISLLLAAYLGISFSAVARSPWAFALITFCAITASGVLGLSATLLYDRLKDGREKPLFVLVLSLGLYTLFQNLFSIFFGDQLQRISVDALAYRPLIDGDGISVSLNQGVVALAAMLGVMALSAIWYLTSIGRLARAVSENRDLAEIVGIDTRRIIFVLAGVSAAGAGLAGVLLALDTGVTPSAGFNYLIPALTAVVVGGNRSMFSTILGAAVVSSVQTSAAFVLGSKWETLAVYALLAMVLLIRPSGILALPMRRT